MGAKSVQDFQGYEFDWLACDGAANVARLITLESLDFSRVEVIPGEVLRQGR